jgi:hypothetical protein
MQLLSRDKFGPCRRLVEPVTTGRFTLSVKATSRSSWVSCRAATLSGDAAPQQDNPLILPRRDDPNPTYRYPEMTIKKIALGIGTQLRTPRVHALPPPTRTPCPGSRYRRVIFEQALARGDISCRHGELINGRALRIKGYRMWVAVCPTVAPPCVAISPWRGWVQSACRGARTRR